MRSAAWVGRQVPLWSGWIRSFFPRLRPAQTFRSLPGALQSSHWPERRGCGVDARFWPVRDTALSDGGTDSSQCGRGVPQTPARRPWLSPREVGETDPERARFHRWFAKTEQVRCRLSECLDKIDPGLDRFFRRLERGRFDRERFSRRVGEGILPGTVLANRSAERGTYPFLNNGQISFSRRLFDHTAG